MLQLLSSLFLFSCILFLLENRLWSNSSFSCLFLWSPFLLLWFQFLSLIIFLTFFWHIILFVVVILYSYIYALNQFLFYDTLLFKILIIHHFRYIIIFYNIFIFIGFTGWSSGLDEKTFRVQCLLKRAEWMRDASCPLTDVLETVMEAR